MRKRIATATPARAQAQEDWLDLERTATVEVTSEDKDFPIEFSLSIEPRQGWRASQPGPQTIRLVFEEKEMMRTQEFVLRISSGPGRPFREILRQQWNFSVPTSTQETEEYQVELPNVSTLELTIVPDISGGAETRLAQEPALILTRFHSGVRRREAT